MLTLAIETATDLVGCALAQDDRVVATFELSHGRRHVESLLPAVDACLAQVGATVDDIGAVVADVGPGLFTGLRVGLATARSLAFALELPVAAVTSLEALAYGARLSGRVTCAAIDARRGEVFWQLFRPDHANDEVRAIGAAACSPPDTGAVVVGATSGDRETPIVGTELDRATAAALAHTGGGRVTGTEVGDEDSFYEVEVTLDDATLVDVQLDKNFGIVDSIADTESGTASD